MGYSSLVYTEPGKAKISNLSPQVFSKKNIRWFDVSVDNWMVCIINKSMDQRRYYMINNTIVVLVKQS